MTEKNRGVSAADLQKNKTLSLATVSQGLQLWKDKKSNAYHPFIISAFKGDSKMAMRSFQCLVVQTECLLSAQRLAFYPDYLEKNNHLILSTD